MTGISGTWCLLAGAALEHNASCERGSDHEHERPAAESWPRHPARAAVGAADASGGRRPVACVRAQGLPARPLRRQDLPQRQAYVSSPRVHAHASGRAHMRLSSLSFYLSCFLCSGKQPGGGIARPGGRLYRAGQSMGA